MFLSGKRREGPRGGEERNEWRRETLSDFSRPALFFFMIRKQNPENISLLQQTFIHCVCNIKLQSGIIWGSHETPDVMSPSTQFKKVVINDS